VVGAKFAHVKKNTYICRMKNLLKGIKDRRTKEQKLSDDVAFLNSRIEDMEAEHNEVIVQYVRKNIQDVGFQKKLLKEMEEDKDHWKKQASILQATIDASENINNMRKMLGLKNAILYIMDFKLPN